MTAKTPDHSLELSQLYHLYHLRDVVFPLAYQMQEQHRVDLNSFCDSETFTQHHCGTKGCLLGWAMTTQQLIDDGWYFNPTNGGPRNKNDNSHDPISRYYGVRMFDALFGTATASGPLRERERRLHGIIAERERALGITKEDAPDDVNAEAPHKTLSE